MVEIDYLHRIGCVSGKWIGSKNSRPSNPYDEGVFVFSTGVIVAIVFGPGNADFGATASRSVLRSGNGFSDLYPST